MAFTVVLQHRAQREIAENAAWLEATIGLRAADRWRVGLLTGVVSAPRSTHTATRKLTERQKLGVDLRELLHGPALTGLSRPVHNRRSDGIRPSSPPRDPGSTSIRRYLTDICIQRARVIQLRAD